MYLDGRQREASRSVLRVTIQWQHSESCDVLHLLLCTVNTMWSLARCGCSSAQCQRLCALLNVGVSLLRWFGVGEK